jgi:hypothetical protein
MQALADAENGNGSGLLDLYDAYLERNSNGTYSNSWEALTAINCLDDPGPTDPNYPDQLAAALRPLAPHFADWYAYEYFCTYWPTPAAPRLKITGAGAGPIVVVGTTGDPITPIEGTKALADSLEHGVLVTVHANQHTGYGTGACVDDAVDNYLIDLKVPAQGLDCS